MFNIIPKIINSTPNFIFILICQINQNIIVARLFIKKIYTCSSLGSRSLSCCKALSVFLSKLSSKCRTTLNLCFKPRCSMHSLVTLAPYVR